jgi:hypothetical protein
LSGDVLWLAMLFLLVATLYSSVGHAGASGYLAAMALIGLAPEQMRRTALALNLLVGGIDLYRFWHGGFVRWRNILPFVLASAPAAFFAAQIKLPKESYSLNYWPAFCWWQPWACSARLVARRPKTPWPQDAKSLGCRGYWPAAASACFPASPAPAARSS